MSGRPSRSNANKNPGRIVLDAAPKRRTSSQKKADDTTAAAKKAMIAQAAKEKSQNDAAIIASTEDALRKEDQCYGIKPSSTFSVGSKKKNIPNATAAILQGKVSVPKNTHKEPSAGEHLGSPVNESDVNDSDFEPEASGDEIESSGNLSMENESLSEAEKTLKSHAKSKEKKSKKTKERATRDAINAARTVPPASGAQNKKRKVEGTDEGPDNATSIKRSKSAYASNLDADWRKKLDGKAKKSASKKQVLTDEDEPGLIPNVDRSHSSSRTSKSRRSSEDALDGGIFDVDEDADVIEAARKSKDAAKPKQTRYRMEQPAMAGRTTGQMGLKFAKKDVDDAVTEAKEHKRGSNAGGKPLKTLKASDLPFTGDADHKTWDRLVRTLLDWAGTVDDPFGTNEHPELSKRLQDLWDMLFPHLELDISDYPAIKKLATDRLNDWRSQFGKNAISRLDKFFRDQLYRNDPEARAEFVRTQLPQVIKGKTIVPFLYADAVKLTGSWQSTLLLDILAWHVKRVGDSFQVFGRPSGALAMSAAAFQRALTLYKTGNSEKDEKIPDARGKRKPGIDFDNVWGISAQKFAKFTTNLPETKWERILEDVSDINQSPRNIAAHDEESTDDTFDIPLSDEDEDEEDLGGDENIESDMPEDDDEVV
ncbi:hypothetical protein BJ138DRAFT_1125980 [Hygrophoropsis aurantiaca]|uniref:Uncharacterized protein n=1 Tax=Hygrophoropsis aurantiaca TaxID=72124 RepID=A0ACB8ADX8_9AGAM|nr:hypothetical protein BJ138DRAFT_1125980 [Hygrophoropsis aurantiaca]